MAQERLRGTSQAALPTITPEIHPMVQGPLLGITQAAPSIITRGLATCREGINIKKACMNATIE